MGSSEDLGSKLLNKYPWAAFNPAVISNFPRHNKIYQL